MLNNVNDWNEDEDDQQQRYDMIAVNLSNSNTISPQSRLQAHSRARSFS